MRKVALTTICKPKQWKTLPTSELKCEGFPVYGANGIIGYYDTFNHENPTVAITCRGATCGTVNLTRPQSYITGNAMCLDEVDDDIEVKYLFYVMQAYDFTNVISGSAQPQITREGLQKVVISIHDHDKQVQIVNTLEHIDTLIEQRNEEFTLLDQIVKSRFIEMFGDQRTNPFCWDMVTIGDIATEVRYGTSRPAVEGGKYPYLRMNNLTYEGYLDLTDLKYIDIPDNEIEKCVVRNGDVLFNRTNSVELVGKTCVYNLDYDMIIAGYIIRVRIDDRMLPVVLSNYLNSTVLKEQLRSMAKGAVNQANINAQELQSIPIYLPPIDLQHEFAAFVEQIDKSKFEIQQSLEKLEILKKSLMQQYFG